MDDQAHQIIAVDPAHPLAAAAQPAAQAEFERGEQARQESAAAVQHQAGAQHDGADGGAGGGGFPIAADTGRKARPACGGFIKRIIILQAINADGRTADQHGRLVIQPGDQGDHGAGDGQA